MTFSRTNSLAKSLSLLATVFTILKFLTSVASSAEPADYTPGQSSRIRSEIAASEFRHPKGDLLQELVSQPVDRVTLQSVLAIAADQSPYNKDLWKVKESACLYLFSLGTKADVILPELTQAILRSEEGPREFNPPTEPAFRIVRLSPKVADPLSLRMVLWSLNDSARRELASMCLASCSSSGKEKCSLYYLELLSYCFCQKPGSYGRFGFFGNDEFIPEDLFRSEDLREFTLGCHLVINEHPSRIKDLIPTVRPDLFHIPRFMEIVPEPQKINIQSLIKPKMPIFILNENLDSHLRIRLFSLARTMDPKFAEEIRSSLVRNRDPIVSILDKYLQLRDRSVVPVRQ